VASSYQLRKRRRGEVVHECSVEGYIKSVSSFHSQDPIFGLLDYLHPAFHPTTAVPPPDNDLLNLC
jgi:hypothetical protein